MKLFSTSSLLIPKILKTIISPGIEKIIFLLFKEIMAKNTVNFKSCSFFKYILLSVVQFTRVDRKVKVSKTNIGILGCGSGTGMNIAANKHKNVRAAQCFNTKSTKLSRLHNDANIITLGSRLISKKNALKFVSIFLNTNFDGGRHLKRVKKI